MQRRLFPADLAAVLVFVGIVNVAVFAPVIRDTPLRVPLGLTFVLFLPGYALIAGLFPEEGEPPTAADEEAEEDGWLASRDRGIDGIERTALSFGLSIAVVPLIGLALNFTPWGIRLVPIMVATSGFTLIMVAVAAYRRWQLPPSERFRVPYGTWFAAGRAEVFEPDDRVDALLNVALALSIVLAVGLVGFAVMFPAQGEQFTEFYLLTEGDDRDLVAADFPEELVVGETASVIVGISNQEHRTVNYTVIVQLQEVDFETDETGNVTNVTVLDAEEVSRFDARLSHNQTLHEQVEIGTDDAEMVGSDRRVQFLLYADVEGAIPADPSDETAYRDGHLWMNVSQSP